MVCAHVRMRGMVGGWVDGAGSAIRKLFPCCCDLLVELCVTLCFHHGTVPLCLHHGTVPIACGA